MKNNFGFTFIEIMVATVLVMGMIFSVFTIYSKQKGLMNLLQGNNNLRRIYRSVENILKDKKSCLETVLLQTGGRKIDKIMQSIGEGKFKEVFKVNETNYLQTIVVGYDLTPPEYIEENQDQGYIVHRYSLDILFEKKFAYATKQRHKRSIILHTILNNSKEIIGCSSDFISKQNLRMIDGQNTDDKIFAGYEGKFVCAVNGMKCLSMESNLLDYSRSITDCDSQAVNYPQVGHYEGECGQRVGISTEVVKEASEEEGEDEVTCTYLKSAVCVN